MSVPVSELIARNVLTTVQGVTVANSYNYTIVAARHARSGDKRAHLSATIIQDDPRPASEAKGYFTLEWWLPFKIGVYVIPLESDTTPIDTYINAITADIQNALMVDRYRGGNALDTKIVAPQLIADEESKYDLVCVNCEVHYRTKETDAYTRV